MHAELPIEPHVRAVAAARHWARTHFVDAGLEPGVIDVLVLLVSETVTNAVLHAHPPVLLRIDVDHVRTRVEVHDGDRSDPVLRDPPPSATNGRGVLVMDRLATRWGTEMLTDDEPAPLADGAALGRRHAKTVWFELAHGGGSVAPSA